MAEYTIPLLIDMSFLLRFAIRNNTSENNNLALMSLHKCSSVSAGEIPKN